MTKKLLIADKILFIGQDHAFGMLVRVYRLADVETMQTLFFFYFFLHNFEYAFTFR